MTTTTLFYGDNLDIVREHVPDESVDPICVDPPCNSKRSYNILFREANGVAADSQITVFDETWRTGQTAEGTLRETETTADPHATGVPAFPGEAIQRSRCGHRQEPSPGVEHEIRILSNQAQQCAKCQLLSPVT